MIQGPGRILDSMLESWRRLGLVRSYNLTTNYLEDTWILRLMLPSRETMVHELRMDEIRLDGEASIWRWLSVIEGDLRRRHVEWRRRLEGEHFIISDGFDERWPIRPFPRNRSTNARSVADQTAEKLFAMVAGQEAFNTLKAGKPLLITGSLGTKYYLFARATFCVKRINDNAELCAVVPGVPLWDHLLGIKLMIEHSEDRFLRTANIAHG